MSVGSVVGGSMSVGAEGFCSWCFLVGWFCVDGFILEVLYTGVHYWMPGKWVRCSYTQGSQQY